MKKNLFFVAAALAAMFGTTSCVNEVDMFKYNGTGTINLSVTNDDVFATTRASVNPDAENWFVNVKGETMTVKALGTKGFAAGEAYTLKAYNFSSDSEAEAANSNRGTARYEGDGKVGENTTFSVVAGQATAVTAACGKAKNGKLSVVFNENFTNLYKDYSVVATRSSDSRSITYDATNATDGFFSAGSSVSYVLSYKPKTAAAEATPTTVNSKANLTISAGTASVLTITANTNGTISLSLTYDETWSEGDKPTITIDAATGEEVNP